MLTQQLNLTSDQQEKIKPILEDESKQMESLRSDSSLTQQERRSKMQEIRQNTNSQIKPILDTEQQTQWQQMMATRARGRPDGVPAAASRSKSPIASRLNCCASA